MAIWLLALHGAGSYADSLVCVAAARLPPAIDLVFLPTSASSC